MCRGSAAYTVFLFSGVALALLAYCYNNSPIVEQSLDDIEIVQLSGKFRPGDGFIRRQRIAGLKGPECVAEDHEGNLFSGIEGGIVKITKSQREVGRGPYEFIYNGEFSAIPKTTEAASKARPLGIRLRGNVLYVMDATYGFYSINVVSKEVTHLVTPDATEPWLKAPNDLDITADGEFAYFTDISSLPLTSLGLSLFEGSCSGRLFQYDFSSGKHKSVLSELCASNGVQLSQNGSLIYVAEITHFRVKIFDTTTWKLKKTIPLPMMPDNIRMSKRGTYWVSGSGVPTATSWWFRHVPYLRQTLAGMLTSDDLARCFFWFHDLKHSVAVEINDEGDVLRTIQDVEGDVAPSTATVLELQDGSVALGSYFNDFMSIVELP